VIDRNNPGKYHGSSTGQCPNVVCTGPDANVETLKASTHEFHNSPAYWRAGDIEVDVKPPEPRGVPPNSPQNGH
jgi:hypothetical protein